MLEAVRTPQPPRAPEPLHEGHQGGVDGAGEARGVHGARPHPAGAHCRDGAPALPSEARPVAHAELRRVRRGLGAQRRGVDAARDGLVVGRFGR